MSRYRVSIEIVDEDLHELVGITISDTNPYEALARALNVTSQAMHSEDTFEQFHIRQPDPTQDQHSPDDA